MEHSYFLYVKSLGIHVWMCLLFVTSDRMNCHLRSVVVCVFFFRVVACEEVSSFDSCLGLMLTIFFYPRFCLTPACNGESLDFRKSGRLIGNQLALCFQVPEIPSWSSRLSISDPSY